MKISPRKSAGCPSAAHPRQTRAGCSRDPRVLFAVGIVLLSGCTAQGPYCGNTADKHASVVAGTRYNLAFIEFGEQGSYQDISQLQDAAELIKRTARPFVVTYIHGWHNNAVSNDVDRFRAFLNELSRSPSIQRSNYNVIGVYLGWRGEITKFPGITELTFWSRKAAAERLASNLDCYDAIATISETARKYHKQEGQYTILVGHSFGGLVVERSVAHAINAMTHGYGDSEKSLPADLIVLLNSASDSILARQMIAALYSRHLEGKQQFVVSLTSSGDGATGNWFRVGTSVAAISKVFDKVGVPGREKGEKKSEKLFYTSTPGHSQFLVNHETKYLRLDPNRSGKTAFEANLSGADPSDPYVFATPLDQSKSGPLKLWRFERVGSVDVPYWDVRVSPAIIKDHGDVWNDKAQAMVAAIFRLNFPLPRKLTTIAPQKRLAPGGVTVPALPKPQLNRERDFNRLY